MDLLISAGRVILGPATEKISPGAVLIRDDLIEAVDRPDRLEHLVGNDVRRLSLPRATLLPGLIDTHVHLAFDAGPDPVGTLERTDNLDLLPAMAGRARRLLDVGVTTVRDLGDRDGLAFRLRQAIAGGALPGPRILAAGTPLTTPGGHCSFFGGEVDGPAAIRALVRRNAEAGADVIKVMATGGGLTPDGVPTWKSQFTGEELELIVAEARAVDLPVSAHAHGTGGIASAVRAGVDTIEHCTWMVEGGFEAPEDVVDRIASKRIFVCPGASPNWRDFAENIGRPIAEQIFDRVRWMDERGVPLISGTDGGVPGAVFDNAVGSLEFYAYLGFPPEKILDLATVRAAEAIGLGTRVGRLAAGRAADLLVVHGNPLDDLNALRDLRLVVAGGRPHIPAPAFGMP